MAGEKGQEQNSQQASGSTLTVVVVEDQADIRRGLEVLINGTPGHRCIGAFGSMEEALRWMSGPCPRLALVDIGLPGMSGIAGIPLLRQRCPETTVLVLTVIVMMTGSLELSAPELLGIC